MTPEEKTIVDNVVEQVKKLVHDNTKGFINDGELEAKVTPIIQKAIPQLKDLEEFKSLQGELQQMGLAIKAMEEKPKATPFKSFEQALFHAFMSNKDALKKLERTPGNEKVTFKVASDMTLAGETSGSVVLPQWEPGLIWPGSAAPVFASRSNVRPATSALIWYAQKTAQEGTNAAQTEGSAKAQRSFTIAGGTSTAWVAAGWSKVTRQMLADVQELMNEVQGEIAWQVNDFVDKVVYGGQTPTGLKDVVHDFDLTTADLAVADPTIANCIGACIAQIQQHNFNPTTVYLNPINYWDMLMEKSLDGVPIIPQFTNLSSVWGGIEIVSSNQVTAGDIFVGDMTKSQVRILDSFNVQIGYDGNDFTHNEISILGEMRLHNWVASNHYGAFVYDTIADIKAAITKQNA